MRLCALLETSDGKYHICCGQFSFFRPWSLLLSNLKLRSRSLSAIMDLMRNPCKLRTYGLCLQVSEYRTGARFLAKIFQLPVGHPDTNRELRRSGRSLCAAKHRARVTVTARIETISPLLPECAWRRNAAGPLPSLTNGLFQPHSFA
jgi:hypothetical protein